MTIILLFLRFGFLGAIFASGMALRPQALLVLGIIAMLPPAVYAATRAIRHRHG